MDIVYTSPGIKTMAVWENGEKRTEPRLYLQMYLKEAYALFKNTHPDITICFSSFCTLRPKNVLTMKNFPNEQCKCRLHENFFKKMTACGQTYDLNFWNDILCDSESMNGDCWKGVCDKCGNGQLLLFDGHDSKEIVWEEWEFDENNHLRIVIKSGCLGELKECVMKDLPEFREHVRIKRIQSASFDEARKCVDGSVLQMDFAMAYSCEYQDESQTALWGRNNVNLFTMALFDNKDKCWSFIGITESDKNKDTIYTFVSKICAFIKEKNIGIGQKLAIFTDGPTSEFKNKYMVKLVEVLHSKLNCKISWQYFATSHGKGVVDGIGGLAKSMVRKEVMARRTVVQNSMDFFSTVIKVVPSTTPIHVSAEEIEATITEENPWDDVKDAPGIKRTHCVVHKNDGIHLYRSSLMEEELGVVKGYVNLRSCRKESLAVGDWVIVQYDGKNYPGEVVIVGVDDVKVNVMHRIFAGFWKWPATPDEIFYPNEKIQGKINPPEPVGRRGQFRFNEVNLI